MAILEKLCYNEERGHGALIYEQSRPFRVRTPVQRRLPRRETGVITDTPNVWIKFVHDRLCNTVTNRPTSNPMCPVSSRLKSARRFTVDCFEKRIIVNYFLSYVGYYFRAQCAIYAIVVFVWIDIYIYIQKVDGSHFLHLTIVIPILLNSSYERKEMKGEIFILFPIIWMHRIFGRRDRIWGGKWRIKKGEE